MQHNYCVTMHRDYFSENVMPKVSKLSYIDDVYFIFLINYQLNYYDFKSVRSFMRLKKLFKF